jgi:hypothetical protein
MAARQAFYDFESQYGVIYRAHLRDGEDFSGKAKRAARKMAEQQVEQDEELFQAFGGAEKVRRRLLAKWDDPMQSLARLTRAEDRMLVMIGLEEARLAAVEVVRINEIVGHGLVATRPIRLNEFIGEYTGVLRRPRACDNENRYLAGTKAYGDCEDFLIDGRDEGNVTRFINHSFTATNVRSEHAFFDDRWHRVLRAQRDLKAGEQLLWDYGADYWRLREAPAEL